MIRLDFCAPRFLKSAYGVGSLLLTLLNFSGRAGVGFGICIYVDIDLSSEFRRRRMVWHEYSHHHFSVASWL